LDTDPARLFRMADASVGAETTPSVVDEVFRNLRQPERIDWIKTIRELQAKLTPT